MNIETYGNSMMVTYYKGSMANQYFTEIYDGKTGRQIYVHSSSYSPISSVIQAIDTFNRHELLNRSPGSFSQEIIQKQVKEYDRKQTIRGRILLVKDWLTKKFIIVRPYLIGIVAGILIKWMIQ